MSERENLQTVECVREALLRIDLPALLTFCTDDLEILRESSAKVPWVHPWRGCKQAEQYFKAIFAALEFQDYAADEFIFVNLSKSRENCAKGSGYR